MRERSDGLVAGHIHVVRNLFGALEGHVKPPEAKGAPEVRPEPRARTRAPRARDLARLTRCSVFCVMPSLSGVLGKCCWKEYWKAGVCGGPQPQSSRQFGFLQHGL